MRLQQLVSNYFTRSKTFVQAPRLNCSNRNRAALVRLRELNYPMDRIRRALCVLNGINLKHIGDGSVSPPTIYNTLKGVRSNDTARTIVARNLGLKEEELFPT